MFDRATIVRVCVPIICRGMTETCEEELETYSASEEAACRWLAGWAAPPVVREKSAAAVESI